MLESIDDHRVEFLYMLLKTLVLLLLVRVQFVHADYIRFWTGLKKQAVSNQKFLDGLNDIFFKTTVEQSKINDQYLINAYIPVLLDEKGVELPNEVALVIYKDEKSYQDIRKTDLGIKYADMHWQYFDSEHSRSVVPEKYPAKIERDHAYEVKAYSGWKNSSVLFRATLKKISSNQVADIIESTLKASGIEGYVVLFNENYLIEFIAFDKKRVSIIKRPDYDTETIYLSNRSLNSDNEKIGWHQGVNWSW